MASLTRMIPNTYYSQKVTVGGYYCDDRHIPKCVSYKIYYNHKVVDRFLKLKNARKIYGKLKRLPVLI